MKFWITRLNATLITSLLYLPQPNTNNQNTEKLVGRDDEQAKLINQLKEYDEVKGVINHSRTLSLSLYQNQLIYYTNAGCQYYYRAKNNLLYILMKDSKESLQLSINSIDCTILNVIKLYEEKCVKLNCSCRLPRKLTPYQSAQLMNLAQEIKQIVTQQEYQEIELNRASSLPEQTVPQIFQQQIDKTLHQRSQTLNAITSSAKNMEKKPKMFQAITYKNIKRYRLKQGFFVILVFCLLISSIAIYNYHLLRNQILI